MGNIIIFISDNVLNFFKIGLFFLLFILACLFLEKCGILQKRFMKITNILIFISIYILLNIFFVSFGNYSINHFLDLILIIVFIFILITIYKPSHNTEKENNNDKTNIDNKNEYNSLSNIYKSEKCTLKNDEIFLIDDNFYNDTDIFNMGFEDELLISTIEKSIKSNENNSILINGKWGSGKTTLINRICEKIRGNNIVFVNFEPWLYSNDREMLKKLFDDISFECTKKSENSDLSKILSGLYYAMYKSNNFFANFIYNCFIEESVDDSIDKINEKLVETNLNIILIIDNVDRCSNKQIISLNKFLSIILRSKKITKISLFDKKILEKKISNEISNDDNYLEKIYNIRLDVPIPSKAKYREVGNNVFNKMITYYKLSEIFKIFSIDELDVFNNIFSYSTSIRNLIRILNNFSLSLYFFNNYINKFNINIIDFLLIKYLREFSPNLYALIARNEYIFVNDSYLSINYFADLSKYYSFKQMEYDGHNYHYSYKKIIDKLNLCTDIERLIFFFLFDNLKDKIKDVIYLPKKRENNNYNRINDGISFQLFFSDELNDKLVIKNQFIKYFNNEINFKEFIEGKLNNEFDGIFAYVSNIVIKKPINDKKINDLIFNVLNNKELFSSRDIYSLINLIFINCDIVIINKLSNLLNKKLLPIYFDCRNSGGRPDVLDFLNQKIKFYVDQYKDDKDAKIGDYYYKDSYGVLFNNIKKNYYNDNVLINKIIKDISVDDFEDIMYGIYIERNPYSMKYVLKKPIEIPDLFAALKDFALGNEKDIDSEIIKFLKDNDEGKGK